MQRYRIAPDASFRVIGKVVACRRALQEEHLAIDLYRLALEFALPRTVNDVYQGLETSLSADELRAAVEALAARGILESASEDSGPCITQEFRSDLLADPKILPHLGAQLAEGRVILIQDAFNEPFAERMHSALAASNEWQPYEMLGAPFFHFHHRNIYDRSRFPRELGECEHIFGSKATRALLGGLTGLDCAGPVALSASMYLPGDHSLPHTDCIGSRAMSFVWHLTRYWQSDWGGDFVWGPSGAAITPRFNSLILFAVSPQSMHFVSVVAPHAKGRRMSVNGWWQRGADTPAGTQNQSDSRMAALGVLPGRYGQSTRVCEQVGGVLIL
jgi:hypothetical protein